MSHISPFVKLVFATRLTEGKRHGSTEYTLSEDVLKELMLGNQDTAVATLLEEVFNAILKSEADEQIGASSYERSPARVTYRNGYRDRQLTTRVGSLTLHVPKLRDGTFSTQLFESYERSKQALLLSIMEMSIQGVSTRRGSQITEELCGTKFSKSTVSALCQKLDPVIEAFRGRPLSSQYPFVMLDAIYTRGRENGHVRSKGLLVAIGLNHVGYREVLGFSAGDGESYESWTQFLRSLKERGLNGVWLVTSDNLGGLVKAIREQFEGSLWQRCQTHFSRNLLEKVGSKDRCEVKALLKDLYNSLDLDAARRRRDELLDKLERFAPKAAQVLDEGFDDITTVFRFPEQYRRRLRTSNAIERVNEELRRRERVIRIFPNDKSIERKLGAILIEMHERWISGQPYFKMDELYRQLEAERKEGDPTITVTCIAAR